MSSQPVKLIPTPERSQFTLLPGTSGDWGKLVEYVQSQRLPRLVPGSRMIYYITAAAGLEIWYDEEVTQEEINRQKLLFTIDAVQALTVGVVKPDFDAKAWAQDLLAKLNEVGIAGRDKPPKLAAQVIEADPPIG